MSSEKYQTEVIRRVYDNSNGQYVTVSPSADFGDGNIMLFVEKDQEEYFGSLRLDLSSEFMRKVGEALIAAADEAAK